MSRTETGLFWTIMYADPAALVSKVGNSEVLTTKTTTTETTVTETTVIT